MLWEIRQKIAQIMNGISPETSEKMYIVYSILKIRLPKASDINRSVSEIATRISDVLRKFCRVPPENISHI